MGHFSVSCRQPATHIQFQLGVWGKWMLHYIKYRGWRMYWNSQWPQLPISDNTSWIGVVLFVYWHPLCDIIVMKHQTNSNIERNKHKFYTYDSVNYQEIWVMPKTHLDLYVYNLHQKMIIWYSKHYSYYEYQLYIITVKTQLALNNIFFTITALLKVGGICIYCSYNIKPSL